MKASSFEEFTLICVNFTEQYACILHFAFCQTAKVLAVVTGLF